MRVLVTGATGFVGYHTVRALVEAGHDVLLGVRDPEKMRRLYEPVGLADLDFAEGCITDEAAVDRALDGCDGVVHTAAMVSLDAGHADQVHATNVRGAELVVGGAVERGLRSIVYVSSITAIFTPGLERLTEQSPIGSSTSGYGQSKVECEVYVRGLQEQGAPISITYPTGIMGPDDPGYSEPNRGLAHFLNVLLYETSSGYQLIDVRDLAQVHVRLLDRERAGRYVVGGHYLPWKAFGDLVEEVSGQRLRRVPAPAGLVRLMGSAGDVVKRFVSFDFPMTREAVTYGCDWVFADSSRLCDEFGFAFRDPGETITDTIVWLESAGHIGPKWIRNLRADPAGPHQRT